MAAVELTAGIVTTDTSSTLTYTPDLPVDSDAEVYAVVTDASGSTTTARRTLTGGGVQAKLAAIAGRYRHSKPTATKEGFGLGLTDAQKWDGGVLAPNGKIYACPRSANEFLVIDTVNGGAVVTDFGYDLSLGGLLAKWGYGGVLAADGRIYFCPRSAPVVLILDPATDTVEMTDYGLVGMAEDTKWRGGVATPDGRVFFIPSSSSTILIIDVWAQTAQRSNLGAAWSFGNRWMGGTLAPNGKIYCTPVEADSCLVINPATMTAVTTTFGLSFDLGSPDATAHKWTGSCLGPDGKIYAVPNGATQMLVIDPSNDTATFTDLGATLSTVINKWSGSVLGADGKIYCAPFDAGETKVLVIDPVGQTAEVTDLGAGGFAGESKWVGGAQGFDGNVYFIPRRETTVLKIDTKAPPMPEHLVLGQYLNKY